VTATETDGGLRVAGRSPAADPGRPGERSVAMPGGGYDRVGGSRLTGFGAIVLAVLVFGAWTPARTTDGQVVAVMWVALLAIWLVGVIVPLVAVRRVSVIATSPRDATVGELVPLAVTVAGPASGVEVRALDPTGSWHRTGSGSGELPHLADRRGVFGLVRLEVRVTAPLGVLAAHRVHDVVLPAPVEVAPRALAVTWLATPAPVEGGAHRASAATATGDLVRSVRPYASGDPRHLVHWPSSARLGDLVVRELEPPTPVGQAVVVDLRDLGDDTERAVSYALGACRAVLASGGELVLATAEADGAVVGPVRTSLQAGRRLARVVAGPPGPAPAGWPVVEIGT
jgi:uncharacterized protein (DUF58 family)